MDASKADLSKILDPKTVLLRKHKVSAASDEIQMIDKKAPAVSATVGRSKEVVASANRELDKHKQWLEQHRSPYVQALDGCLRKIERRRLIRACGHAVLTTARVLSSVCRTSLHTALRRLTDPRDFQWRVNAQLQKRIDAMDPLTDKAPLLSRMQIVRTAFQSRKRRIIFGFPRRTLHHTIPSG